MAVRDRQAAEALTARVPPVGLVLTGITSIQFGAALAATLFDEVGAAGISALRLALAAVILWAVWRPDPRALGRGEIRVLLLFGASLGLMNLTFYEAIARIPLGAAVTIEFAGPLAVAVLTSQRRLDLVWAALAAAGILLLARPWGGGGLDPAGVGFALVAAAFWAAYILLAARTGGMFTGGRGLAMAMVVAALVPLGPGLAQAGGELLAPGLLLPALAVALLSSAIPYSLEMEALRRMPRHVFGVLMSLEPAVGALAGLIVLGQGLGPAEALAVGLVVAASVGVSRSRPASPAPVEA